MSLQTWWLAQKSHLTCGWVAGGGLLQCRKADLAQAPGPCYREVHVSWTHRPHVHLKGCCRGQRWAGGGRECPRAAVTDDHTLHGFKQKFIVSQFWRPASEIKESSGPRSLNPRGESPSLSLWSFWLVVSLRSLPTSHGSVPRLRVSSPLTVKTLVIGVSAQPKSRMSAIKILNYLQRTYFQIRSHSEVLSGCEFGGHCSAHRRSLSTCCVGALLRARLEIAKSLGSNSGSVLTISMILVVWLQ